jgi:hypothetical protein
MKKDDLLYGLADWESLEGSFDDVIERVMTEAFQSLRDKPEDILNRIKWPIKVLVYRRMDTGGEKTAQYIADIALENAMEFLDDNHAGDDANFEPTEKMKAAALAFGRAIIEDYVSYNCEPTGKVIEYTREEAEKEQGEPK